MRRVTVENVTRGAALGDRVGLADRWWLRLRGLLGRPEPGPGEGLLLTPCNSVHMHGMRYALDVAVLSPDGVVVATYAGLPPGGRTRWHRGARHTLELPVGTLAATGTGVGDRLAWGPSPAARGAPAGAARAAAPEPLSGTPV
jgi:uncharacterized membrane protein (UPF0127 family)